MMIGSFLGMSISPIKPLLPAATVHNPRINCKGVSARDIARQKGHAKCVRVLEAMLA